MRDDIEQRLREALMEAFTPGGKGSLLDAILPTVRALIAEAREGVLSELRQMVEAHDPPPDDGYQHFAAWTAGHEAMRADAVGMIAALSPATPDADA